MSIKQIETLAADAAQKGKKWNKMGKSFKKRDPVKEEPTKEVNSPLKDDDWKFVEKTVGAVKTKGFKSQGWRVLGATEKLPKSGPAVVITIRDREYALVRMPAL